MSRSRVSRVCRSRLTACCGACTCAGARPCSRYASVPPRAGRRRCLAGGARSARFRRHADLHPDGRVDHLPHHLLDQLRILVAHDVGLELRDRPQTQHAFIGVQLQKIQRLDPGIEGQIGHACGNGRTTGFPLFLHGGGDSGQRQQGLKRVCAGMRLEVGTGGTGPRMPASVTVGGYSHDCPQVRGRVPRSRSVGNATRTAAGSCHAAVRIATGLQKRVVAKYDQPDGRRANFADS